MRKKQLLFAVCACMLLFTGCKSKEKIDLSSTHTTAEATTEVAKETMPATTAPETTKAASAAVETSMETYKNQKISIQYPAVSNLSDESMEQKVNTLLKDNALSVIKGYEMDESKDSLTVTAKVISVNRKRIVITYEGIYTPDQAAHPVNLFYSNTVDLDGARNLGLNDYADAYTVAGYIVSGDYKFANVTGDLEKAARESLKTGSHTVDSYYDMLSKADFSSSDNFPKVFSYEEQGTVFISIPVEHSLGDYVLIKYIPDNK